MHSPSTHPLALLNPDEIDVAVATLRAAIPDVKLQIKKLDLKDAPKSKLVAYLEAERLGLELPEIPGRYVKTLFRRKQYHSVTSAVEQGKVDEAARIGLTEILRGNHLRHIENCRLHSRYAHGVSGQTE